MFVDTHSHIFYGELFSRIDKVIYDAKSEKVEKILVPNIDGKSLDKLFKVQNKFPSSVSLMLGLHPCDVKKNFQEEIEHIFSFWEKEGVCAVGEIGLDLYHSTEFAKEQVDAFLYQCRFSTEKDAPVSIHCRKAFDEIFSAMKQLKTIPRGVFHCFTGTLPQAKTVLEMGLYLGIGGVLTYKNSGLDKVIKKLPLEKMVLETDAPFLTPHPFRKYQNEPKYISVIAKKLAEIKNIPVEEVEKITSENAQKIFGI